RLPFTSVSSFITVILIMTFFVTSSDSGSLVIDSLASGGVAYTPAWQRAFWAIMEGVVASVLLLAGGLNALQTMTVVSALPFAIIMLIAAVGMWRALSIETHRDNSLRHHMQANRHSNDDAITAWKKRLAGIVHYPNLEEVQTFISG